MDETYTKRFALMIRLGQWGNALPWRARKGLGALFGRYFSFLRLKEQQIVENISRNLGLPRSTSTEYFVDLCRSSGVAFQMANILAGLSDEWIAENVITRQRALLDRIKSEGGVILSHHSFHHNLLIASLKHWGLSTSVLANPPAAQSDDERIYRFTVKLNADTESNLNGGRFLYVNEGKELIRSIKDCLKKKTCILLFCDFNEPKPFNRQYQFLGSQIQPPSGVIRYAHRKGSPFYFAGLTLSADYKYHLHIERLEPSGTALDAEEHVDHIMQLYISALEAFIRDNPSCWQHWDIL